jgi:hypothetical protein
VGKRERNWNVEANKAVKPWRALCSSVLFYMLWHFEFWSLISATQKREVTIGPKASIFFLIVRFWFFWMLRKCRMIIIEIFIFGFMLIFATAILIYAGGNCPKQNTLFRPQQQMNCVKTGMLPLILKSWRLQLKGLNKVGSHSLSVAKFLSVGAYICC